ncbi:MAG: lasso peptide biosynthesis B2 protein [Leptolyngbyaceae cyanobacterium]
MQRQFRQLAKLKHLRQRDLSLLAIAFFLLNLIRLGLWLMPFRVLCSLLRRISQLAKPSGTENCKAVQHPQHSRRVTKLVWAIQVAGRYSPGGAKCLARALATQVLMDWHHYRSELRIGVDKTSAGEFRAHAWIEYRGRVIVGNLKDLSQFTPLLAHQGSEL